MYDSPPTVLDSIAALKTWSAPSGDAVLVTAYEAGALGGGGLFARSGAHPSEADNGVTRVTDARGRTWERLDSGEVDIRWAGARCDGVTDDAAAVLRAVGAGAVVFPAGVTRIAASLTLKTPARVAPGARLELAKGVVLRFAAGFQAGLGAVFQGDGRVVFDPAFLTVGHPEWWGARPDAGDFDCQPALSAALRACRVVELAAADYFMASTLVIDTPHRTLEGVGRLWQGPGTATRIIIKSASADCIRVGPATDPGGGPNHFLQEVVLRDFAAWREGAVTPPAAGFGGPAGVRLQYCVNCEVAGVASYEHSTAFALTGVVYSRMRDCRAFRSEPGASSLNDVFVGILLDESVSIGLAAGDASLYFEDCAITVGGAPGLTRSLGVYCPRGFTDLFFSRLETAFLDRAMDLRADPTNTLSSQDLQVINCVFDSCALDGLYIEGDAAGNDYRTNINILGCYVAGAGNRFQAGLHLRQVTGCISLTNNQVLGDANATGAGIRLERVNGLVSQGNMLSDCPAPIVVVGASNCRFADVINTSRARTGHAAISVEATRRSVVGCMVRGQTGVFQAGVRLVGGGNGFNEIACSGIDADCIEGGAGAKLIHDGAPVTSAGAFGNNNLATGVMA